MATTMEITIRGVDANGDPQVQRKIIQLPPLIDNQQNIDEWADLKDYLLWIHDTIDKMHRAIELLEHGQYRGQIAGPYLTAGQTPEVLKTKGLRVGLGPDDGKGGGL